MDNTAHSLDAPRHRDAGHYEAQTWERQHLGSRPLSGYHNQPEGYLSYRPDPGYPRQDTPLKPPVIAKEELSDSEVSDTPAPPHEGNRFKAESVVSLSQLPPQPSTDSVEALQAYIEQIQDADNANAKQKATLKAKRQRKDERRRIRREAEDRQIEALHEARRRHDLRIRNRRQREDDGFDRAFQELDQAENATIRRMKRLKRGLPPDESADLERGYSAGSQSSPSINSRATAMPPAKRHQTGPPGPADHMYAQQHSRPPTNGASSTVNSTPIPPPHPAYQFYQGNQQSVYNYPPSYNYVAAPPPPLPGHSSGSPVPPPPATVVDTAPPKRTPHMQRDVSSPAVNGHAQSATGTPSQPTQTSHGASPTNAPIRPSGKEYNTRPPEPRPNSTSGFASINMPATSGFAAINPRGPSNVPFANQVTPVSKAHGDTLKALDTDQIKGERSGDGNNVNTPASSGGKRTPSTTHPYSQSEAFANRHHHCEDTDALGRGIWTSYGPQGTRESPTGPAVKMYLRCNHDGCMRIDWRTVHGLQCHIVKSHEQPKGTIGSLEKALDRYGVPVTDVEAQERETGLGTAGTMADPKNQKIKNKTREMQARISAGSAEPSPGTRRPHVMASLSNSPPPQLPAPTQHVSSAPASTKPIGIGFRPSAMPLNSPMFPNLQHGRRVNQVHTPKSRTHSDDDDEDERKYETKQHTHPDRFGVVKGSWNRVEETPTRERDRMDVDKKEKQPEKAKGEDQEMYDAPLVTQPVAAALRAVETKEKGVVSEARDGESASASTSLPVITTAPATAIPRTEVNSNEVIGKAATEEVRMNPTLSSRASWPATSTIPSDTPVGTAIQEAVAEVERLEEKQDEAEDKILAAAAAAVTEAPNQTQDNTQMTIQGRPQDSVVDAKTTQATIQDIVKVAVQQPTPETPQENQKDKELEDKEMTEEPTAVLQQTSTPAEEDPTPAQPLPSISSPRSTRKPTSRRTSAGVNKMDVDGDSGQQSEDDEKGDEGDTITSMGKGTNGIGGEGRGERGERRGRSKRNAGGRFVKGRKP